MSSMGYRIIISALDAFSTPLRGMANAVRRFGATGERALGQMADNAALNRARLQALVRPLQNINREIKRLGENSGLTNSFKNLGENLSSIGKATGKIAGGLGLVFAGMAFISKQASEHDALAKSVGLSSKSLTAWGGVVSKAGFDTSHVIDLVEEMNNKFGELESLGEMSSATDSLKMLGLRFEDINKLKPEEQFEKIMQAAAELDDPQIAASAVDMLLGGEANKILGLLRAESKATGKSIKELVKEKEKLDLTSEEGQEGNKKMAGESSKLFSTLKSGLTEIVGILGHTLTPLIKKFRVWFVDNFDAIRDNVKKFGEFLTIIFTGTDEDIEKLIETSSGFVAIFLKIVRSAWAGKLIFASFAAILVGPVLLGLGLITIAFIKMGIAMLANPVVLIIMGIIAAIAGLIAIFYYFKDDIMAILKVLGTFFTSLWDDISNGFASLWEKAKVHFLAFWEFFKKYNLFSVGFRLLNSLWDGIKSIWEEIYSWFKEKISSFLDLIPDYVKKKMGISIETEQKDNTKTVPSPKRNTGLAGISATDIKDKFSLSMNNEQNTATQYPSAIAPASKNNMNGTIKVKFENAPENMRIGEMKSDNNLSLNTDLGYNNMPI